MSIGPLVSIKGKGNSMCISDKTEICPFVHINHIIIIHNIIIIIIHNKLLLLVLLIFIQIK